MLQWQVQRDGPCLLYTSGVAFKLVCIKSADAVAVGYARQVHQVYQRGTACCIASHEYILSKFRLLWLQEAHGQKYGLCLDNCLLYTSVAIIDVLIVVAITGNGIGCPLPLISIVT